MNNTGLTMEQSKRLVAVARKIWRTMTPDERNRYYYDTGTIGFVENVASLLGLGLHKVTISEFEAIHTKIFSR